LKLTKPKVYCIAETSLNIENVKKWLQDHEWDECLDHVAGSNSEKLIELSGRRCYRSYSTKGKHKNPNINKIRKDSYSYHKNILEHLHGSVLEHATSTWAIEECSRVATHEIVRHRAGTSFSQESLRFCRLNNLFFWMPPEIEENSEAEKLFMETIQFLEKQQLKLTDIYGIDNENSFSKKKKLTSAFRRIAPIGLATGIIITFNMRSLRWAIENRTSEDAEVEIRTIFGMIAEIATKKWPMIFQDFDKIYTNDGLFEWKPKYRKV